MGKALHADDEVLNFRFRGKAAAGHTRGAEWGGFCARARSGGNCPRSIQPIRPVTGVFSNGYAADNSSITGSGAGTPRSQAAATGGRLAGRHFRECEKRGLGGGADQAWQGDENNGHRRCYQSSSGRHRRSCLAARNNTPRGNPSRKLSNRENRSPTQDGRKLRRYQRRWCVERLFAWLQWFRRLVTRYEYHSENFLDMVRLGCMRIMLRYL
jgi:transposase